MNFELVSANIVNVAADAIVLPANENLKEGSGVSRAIFEAAGRKYLEKACDAIGHCDTGMAVPTSAFGDLNVKFIIHAVVPKWIDGEHNEYGLLSAAYLSSLHLADIMGCESIVFPLLASGNNGFERELAFHIAEESIQSFEGENLRKVIITVYGERTVQFVRTLGYDVLEIKTGTPPKKPIFTPDMKKTIAEKLKTAEKILQKPETKKMIISVGCAVADIALSKNPAAKNVWNAIKKAIKK